MKCFKLLIPVLLSLSIQRTEAQNNYSTHTLKQGETLSALAKQYNTNVGDIMRLNGMHADSKLVYGSKIKIPAELRSTTNKKMLIVNEQINPTPADAGKHKVVQGETLFSISKQYNVSMEQLKTWNNLTDYNIKLGTLLVVGSNKAEISAAPNQIKKERIEAVEQSEKETIPQQKDTKNDIAVSENEQTTNSNPGPKNVNQADNNKPNQNIQAFSLSPVLTQNGEGYFADQFPNKKSRRLQHISGISKTFKTASGWSDGKYYILANDINPGTIVKLTAENGNTVYAKVLWDMGDLRENANLSFRISNATAAALNLNAPAFNLSVSY
jgi:LysM repeat protein